MSTPKTLIDSDTLSKPLAYACATCEHVYGNANDLDLAYKLASTCCDPQCLDCGAKIQKHGQRGRCDACAETFITERDRRVFDKAQKLTETECNDRVDACTVLYCDEYNEYFTDGPDEFREWWVAHHDDKPFPEYLWTCTEKVGVRLDATDILEQALDDYSDDAIDHVDVDSLQAALDAWSAAPENQVQCWEPDYTVAVVLDAEANRHFLRQTEE